MHDREIHQHRETPRHVFVLWATALALLFGFLAYRAFALSLTHDEALSYTIFAARSGWVTSANHHPLNTWSMAVGSRLFGDSELSLRLHSLFAFVGAAVCFLRLWPRRFGTIASLVGFALFFLNPFALEFFALARGYGLSMAGVAGSLYFLLTDGLTRPVRLFASIAMAAMATWANLAAVNFLAAMMLAQGIDTLLAVRARPGWRRLVGSVPAFFLGVIALAIAARWLLFLRGLGQLTAGCVSIPEAFSQFTTASLGGATGAAASTAAWLALVTLAAAPALAIRRRASRELVVAWALLATILLMLVVQRHVLGTNYPPPRAATYLLPLIAVVVSLIVRDALVASGTLAKRIISTVAVAAALILAGNFARQANVTTASAWKFDANTRDLAHILSTIADERPDLPPFSITNHWVLEPALNFYIATHRIPAAAANREGVGAGADFIYTLQDENIPSGYVRLAHFEAAGTVFHVADREPLRSAAETATRRCLEETR